VEYLCYLKELGGEFDACRFRATVSRNFTELLGRRRLTSKCSLLRGRDKKWNTLLNTKFNDYEMLSYTNVKDFLCASGQTEITPGVDKSGETISSSK